ncbi:MAG: EF-hand domain-containing protein [Sphingomicrobium sp.]
MNKFLIGVAALAVAVPALAQFQPGMPNQQRVQTRDQVVAKARDRFARMDSNRDGFITSTEVAALRGQGRQQMRQRGMGRGMSAARAFDRLDANHDGSISRAEFEGARAQCMARLDRDRDGRPDRAMGVGRRAGAGGANGGRMFAMADANHDARLSMEEATNAALRRFDMADANRDGQVTPQERQQMRQQMRAQRSAS